MAPASVTGMLHRLAKKQPSLIVYERYHGVRLTPAGRSIALESIRRHRLLEQYLAETLGYAWDQVDAEAEQLEHVISDEFEEKIAALLGNPTADPHGDPIPDEYGSVVEQSGRPLSQAQPGETVRVVRVRVDDPALLRYLADIGLKPKAVVAILAQAPFDGPLMVSLAGRTQALAKNVAEQILVEVDECCKPMGACSETENLCLR